MPECEQEEVSLVLEYIYTRNFNRPGPLDNEAWMKLWKAAKKFELTDLIAECWQHVSKMTLQEASTLGLDHSETTNVKMKQCTICDKQLTYPLKCLIPCGHACLCSDCIATIFTISSTNDNAKRCPLCRKDIENTIKVYA